ncbi:type VII secretion protein EccB [Corynebacterium uterequi]|uniref:Type VII secretion protein EccB, Actinobacterial n=1 Tax=Corynebacterium uterequi TaxID=1072256 RepID=A0A0G3HAM4_9CORY|nr:type VII secretion protein EccB [Corynebacterium uterequi]AKK10406.1 type VII secretion protein EccB, Actinobacterial [Corynebacterium uterequi]
MSSPMLPTTRVQVSGHKFLRRRVEHGLIFGDIRMIHDPLRSRSRALIFGVVALVLTMLGAGLFAWMKPEARPGEAPILADASGALYVHVDGRVFPVTNLASARLIVGEAADPARAGAEFFAGIEHGPLVGIPLAPGSIAEDFSALPAAWSVCSDAEQEVVVVGPAAPAPPRLSGDAALLVDAAGTQWLVTADGRRELPTADSADGRILRRNLGIGADTALLAVPEQVLSGWTHRPAWALPSPLPTVLDADGTWWARVDDSVTELTPTQAAILLDAGAPRETTTRAAAAGFRDGPPVNLPATVPQLSSQPGYVCALGDGGAGVSETLPPKTVVPGITEVSAVAGMPGQAIAVDTGHERHIIAPTGVRYPISEEGLVALGVASVGKAPWSVVGLLPPGAELSADRARRAVPLGEGDAPDGVVPDGL